MSEVSIEIKIKLDNGSEITLSEKDAESLYKNLKKVFDKKTNVIPGTITYVYPPNWYWWNWQPNWITYSLQNGTGDNVYTNGQNCTYTNSDGSTAGIASVSCGTVNS